MAEGGCSVRRVRRHFADVQDLILAGRSGASRSDSRPSEVGHEATFESGRFMASHFSATAPSAVALAATRGRPVVSNKFTLVSAAGQSSEVGLCPSS